MGIATKKCRYGCGKVVYWDNNRSEKIRWVEVDTEPPTFHDFKRCAQLLKEQNKDVGVLKNK